MKTIVNIFWFRRDLRLNDNHALYQALKAGLPVLPMFIFDKEILDKLDDKYDRRVCFIHQSLQEINKKLAIYNSSLAVFHGHTQEVFEHIFAEYDVKSIYCNHDYEPQAIARDYKIALGAEKQNITFQSYKDQVIFEKNEVLKDDQTPYTVYTPYSKKWLKTLAQNPIEIYPSEDFLDRLLPQNKALPSLPELGFLATDILWQTPSVSPKMIDEYQQKRDFPGLENATSQLSVHLRFGTVSVRQLVLIAAKHQPTWLSELIWREFFMQILFHFPRVIKSSFKPDYDKITWSHNEAHFKAWCSGQTGYPMVDAGMRELNATGNMHNRVRMVVASFLCKHLMIDWRWGEAYFAQKLNDFDLSANNGNWQWAAGCGCDAAPYFRVFNPEIQAKKFDPDGIYLNKWLPDLQSLSYAKPIVEHASARDKAILSYKKALAK